MIEGIKSVLVVLTKEFGPEEASPAIGYGLGLAQEAGAHLTVEAAAQRVQLPNAGVTRFATDLVGEENARLRRLAQEAVATVEGTAAAAGVTATARATHQSFSQFVGWFTALAGVHDLTILDTEAEAIHPDRDLIQALLFRSGRPVVTVPSGWSTFRARRIVVGWDGSGRAARAVHDALPFLRAAEAVQIVAVTGEKELPGHVDGTDLAPHLSRHGVAAEVECRTVLAGGVAPTLRDAAMQRKADMIVMGGYVHSRLRELAFGGVTQSMLRDCPVPLLLSH